MNNAVGYGESRTIYSNPQSEEEHAANRRVELKFLKTIGSDSPSPNIALNGQRFQIKLKVENIDSVAANNIVLRDVLPSANDTTWTFNTLEPGDSLVITYQTTAPNFVDSNPFKLVNASQVSASNDSNLENNTDSITVYIIGTANCRYSSFWYSKFINQEIFSTGHSSL